MIVRSDIAAYRDQLIALLPPGAAWTVEPGSRRWQLLTAMAAEFARVDGRAADLREEADPRTAVELLTDWERVCGLPDPCAGPAETIAERRQRILRVLTSRGGQSRAYFIGVAAALGYAIEIDEFFTFTCVDDCIDAINPPPDWPFTWRVRAPESTVRPFTAEAGCDELLNTWGNAVLECVLSRLKPAHTHVIFTYGAVP